MINRLTPRQRWQLALRILLLYSPLLMYVNMPLTETPTENLPAFLIFFLVFSTVALGLYFLWITATDWVQSYLFRRFGQEFLFKSSGLALVLPIMISLALAVLYIFAFGLIMRGVFTLVFQLMTQAAHDLEPKSAPTQEVLNYVHRANNGFSVAIMLSIFYLTMTTRAYQQLKNVELKAERLEKEAATSQFEALKNQLSPHFLFNSLSILTSLVHEDADLSEQFIKQLSKAYRYILEQRDQAFVPLATELDFIHSYTFLLQIRFENKFDVVIDVPDETRQQFDIAPLSLQMLVENAVKHNRMSVREPLRVHIRQENDYLIVENPLQARDQPEISTGVGLRNITNRYSLLTDRPVCCGKQEGQFVVKIPLLATNKVNG